MTPSAWSLVMMTLSACCFSALPNVSQACIRAFYAKWCVMSLTGLILPDTTVFKSVGVVTVSTRRGVKVIFHDQNFDRHINAPVSSHFHHFPRCRAVAVVHDRGR
ncbi:MAG: hypothetical protein H7222_00390 [Methylotenera sp.]|nr:hypothetical protein [Oligoflexia bacterium]